MSHGALLDAAVAAQAACDAANLPNCIIGGIALQRWGEPRFTCASVEADPMSAPADDSNLAVFCDFENVA